MALLDKNVHVRASMAAERLIPWATRSYSQCGEDLIIRFALRHMGIMRPFYLDLGAHHPTWLSNTYFFYRRGARGICVEADPKLHRKIARRRPRDLCLNVAVGTEDGTATLHVMRQSSLNTISTESLGEYEAMGEAQRDTVTVPMLTPTTLLDTYSRRVPNLVSLDIEGIDIDILRAWDFARHRPEVFIVETVTFAERQEQRKRTEVAELMEDAGYFVYGDTWINTIFVDRAAWTAP